MTLIIDTREPRRMIDILLKEIPDSRVDTLAYGDFMIIGANQRFVIERKQIDDLFSSLNDGRLWAQAKGLEKFEGYKRVLLIEGNFEQARKWNANITKARYTGTKVSMLYGWDNITVMMTEDAEETVDFLRRLDAKAGVGAQEDYTRALGFTKMGRTPNEELIDILRGADGVGEQKAEELLTRFVSIDKITRASLKELETVLAPKDALHVFETCRRKYERDKKAL